MASSRFFSFVINIGCCTIDTQIINNLLGKAMAAAALLAAWQLLAIELPNNVLFELLAEVPIKLCMDLIFPKTVVVLAAVSVVDPKVLRIVWTVA